MQHIGNQTTIANQSKGFFNRTCKQFWYDYLADHAISQQFNSFCPWGRANHHVFFLNLFFFFFSEIQANLMILCF